MRQRTLLSKPKKVLETTPELPGYHKVVHDDEHELYFDKMWEIVGDGLLFDHSRISPFAYFNEGQMELFVNDNWKVGCYMPIIKKFKNTPRYMLYCPIAPIDMIYDKMVELSAISAKPVQAIAVPAWVAEVFKKDGRFVVSKTGDRKSTRLNSSHPE